MNIAKYLNKNKIGGIILIVVIIIAFGFGGFGGGFLSNNQNNIAKINKTNITNQDLIEYFNQSGISQQSIKDNLNDNIIEELLSNLISTKLLDLEINDFDIMVSENSLLKKIKLNDNFSDENGVFKRTKYEKFLLENNISAPLFEQRLKERELQKKLFDFIGAGTVSPEFLIIKLFENENKKLELNFIDLENFYKKYNEFNDQDLLKFIDENTEQLKVEYIDFEYAKINPKNLIGVDEFNQTFFDKIDEIESSILNEISFSDIASEFNLNPITVNDYKYSDDSNEIKKKIYEVRTNNFDIFESNENFIIYKINSLKKKQPNINDKQTKNEILKLVVEKNKFDYNRKLLEQIRNKDFDNNEFLELGKDQIQYIQLNSIRDNKKFDIKSVQMLYSLPINTFTLISDEDNKIYLTQIKSYKNTELKKDSDEFKSYI
ncbi:SurA N-terminal domain-containing protein, partial [Candidatus Pelagibacter sp.]|nr:SurA N-terminal domain-containing protein [Candidatus Pelagibacter sp.]